MRRLGIFIDASAAMNNSSGDFRPNPLLYSVRLLETFLPDFLRRNTLGSAAVFELRDGVCRHIAPATGKWSANAAQIVGDVQQRYQQPQFAAGSGAASIVNALRVIGVELGVGAGDGPAALGFSGGCVSGALLLTGSTTVVDAADVFAAMDDVGKAGVAVDVLSYTGAPHVLESLCARTGGTLMCPVSPANSLQLLLTTVAHPSWRGGGKQQEDEDDDRTKQQQQRRRTRGGNNNGDLGEVEEDIVPRQKTTPVALFRDDSSVPPQCPLCASPQAFHGFPRTCVTCGLLSLSEVQWRTSRAEANAARLVAVTVSPQQQQDQHQQLIEPCRGVCGSQNCVQTFYSRDDDDALSDEEQEHQQQQQQQVRKISHFSVLRCLACEASFCKACTAIFANVRLCPSCGVMLEAIS